MNLTLWVTLALIVWRLSSPQAVDQAATRPDATFHADAVT
jgi:hypothetical protein